MNLRYVKNLCDRYLQNLGYAIVNTYKQILFKRSFSAIPGLLAHIIGALFPVHKIMRSIYYIVRNEKAYDV